MTALARVRGIASGLGGYLGLAILLAIVLILVQTGVLSERRWAPFGDIRVWQFLAEGLWVTIQIGAVSLVASLILAVPLALGRVALPRPLRWIVVAWIELVRATPVLALILGLTLFMPRSVPSMWSATLALTIYTSAVLAEILRAGILAIPRGEIDAARSLGLPWRLTMGLIVLPQAFSRMMPALVSQLITLVKDTSLASLAVGVSELAAYARSTHSFYGNPAETYFLIACIYFAINYTLSRIARRLELTRAKDLPVVLPPEIEVLEVQSRS
jgi:glutamate transport system permease protein